MIGRQRIGLARCSSDLPVDGLQPPEERLCSGDIPGPEGPKEAYVLNRYDRPSPMAGEAEVKYLDGDFRVIKPGAFVRCAVTGVPVALDELKYWCVDLQEAYASPEAVMRRHAALRDRGDTLKRGA